MAALRFSARSRSKCKNPTPSQAQKGPLGKEVTVACLNIIDDSVKKERHESCRAVHKLLMFCCINIFEKMFAKLT